MAFREIKLPWDGVDYFCTPSMRILQRCEQHGMRLSRLIASLADGEPEVANVCMLVGELLRSGGAKVVDESIYQLLMTGKGWDDLVVPVISALAPQEDEKKRDALPAG